MVVVVAAAAAAAVNSPQIVNWTITRKSVNLGHCETGQQLAARKTRQ